MNGLRVAAFGGIALDAGDVPEALAPHFAALGRKAPRRSSRFDQLTLLGALQAINKYPQTLSEDGALYLATGQGNVADTAELLEGLYRRHEAPMPVSFINVSSNLAGFQTAAALGLHGPNLTVSRRDSAFGAALELALSDAYAGRLRQGLIGGVDACCWPLDAHRRRLRVAADTPLGEGSHWLLVDQSAETPCAVIEDARCFPDRASALDHIRSLPADTRLVMTNVSPADAEAFAREAARDLWPVPTLHTPCYDTAGAQHLCHALEHVRGSAVFLEAGRDDGWQCIRFRTALDG
jgi:hypothetical protein